MPINVIYDSSSKAPPNDWFAPLRVRRSLQTSGVVDPFQVLYYDKNSGNLSMTEIGADGFQGDFWSESGVVQHLGPGFTHVLPLTDLVPFKGGLYMSLPLFLAYNKDDGQTKIFQPGMTNDKELRTFPSGPPWRSGWTHIHLHWQAERTAAGVRGVRYLFSYDATAGETQVTRFRRDSLGNFVWDFIPTNSLPPGLQSLTYINPRMGYSDPSADFDLFGYPFIVTCQDGVVRLFDIEFLQDGTTRIVPTPLLQTEPWGTGDTFEVEHWGSAFRDVISLGTLTILHKWILTTESSGVVKIDEVSENLSIPSMNTVFAKRWQAGWKFASLEDILLRYRPADGYMDYSVLRFS
jgi:hypothetical protein